MFPAEFAEFLLFDFILLFLLISGCGVVASFAFCALKGYDISHFFLACLNRLFSTDVIRRFR